MLRVDKDVFWLCTVKSDIRDIDKSLFAEMNISNFIFNRKSGTT